MSLFRPKNLNVRSYPGNGSVVGPTNCPTATCTNRTCYNCVVVCESCTFVGIYTGQHCTFCGCPCINQRYKCTETCTVSNTGSGMWRSSEQHEAATRQAWGIGTAFSCTPEEFDRNMCYEYVSVSNVTDYKGPWYITCDTDSCNYWVSRSDAWYTGDGNTPSCQAALNCNNSRLGSCGWFIPSATMINQARSKQCSQPWPCPPLYPIPTPGYSTSGFHNGPFVVGNRNRITSLGGFRCTGAVPFRGF